MGEGVVVREFVSFLFVELERRCRYNGFFIRGGWEVMVVWLLSLEEVEK